MPTGLGDEELWLSPTVANNVNPFNDQSGNGNNGTAQGGMGTVADSSAGGSYCYQFDGMNDYIYLGNVLNPTGSFTMASWVYSDPLPNNGARATIIEKGYDGLDEPFVFMFADADEIRGYSFDGSLHGNQVAHNASAGQWNQFTCTFNQSTWKMYKNGSLIDTVNDATALSTNNENVLVGASTINSLVTRYWAGRLDDIRTYYRAITEAEITHLATSRGVLGPPGGDNYSPFRNAKYINKTYQIPRFG